jgi:Mannosyl-glycoprotein endo-beta-N-acetylglucosaminidase
MVPRVAPHLKRAYAPRTWCGRSVVASLALSLFAGGASAALPEIRTSTQNKVPACVTPQRLMSFLKSRNPGVEARFADIANIYKRHGERWHVRWDYAFYQMAVETNFLSYKQGNGRWGDVNPRQNNFAGLGTTGGGVPGDSYPDVNTGVLAQIQHLVAYSGEHITDPVGARTKLKQDDIIESMEHFKGHVTFNDLSHRWAMDRHYGASIEWIANSYRAVYCKPGAQRADAEADKTAPAVEATAAPKREAVATKVATAQKLAPAEALGGPKADPVAEPVAKAAVEHATAEAIETPKPATVVAAAAPEAAALPEPIAPAATAAAAPASPETTAAAGPVRTIWSRDNQDASSEPIIAATSTKPAPKTKAAQRIAPLPIAKATMVPTAPVAVAAAEPPVTAAPESASRPVPVAKTEAAPASAVLHVPEERPVEEPAPAIVTIPATAAIESATPALPALEEPVDARAFAFAQALNLAELSPSPQSNPAAAATSTCRVLAASYGGKKTLLVRTQAGAETHYTALTVLDGFEASMFQNFVKAQAPGGASLGEYETKDAALAKAKELCPGSAAAPKAEGASAG